MMDPLKELWDLAEGEFMGTPEDMPQMPGMGTPDMMGGTAGGQMMGLPGVSQEILGGAGMGQEQPMHPVAQQRMQIDQLRATGMPTQNAWEMVNGPLGLDDSSSKSSLAATMGRVQDDKRRGVKIDVDAQDPSLMAQDYRMAMQAGAITSDDLKSSRPGQEPDVTQNAPAVDGMDPHLDVNEEADYNWDVAYLQKYGRA